MSKWKWNAELLIANIPLKRIKKDRMNALAVISPLFVIHYDR
jgi:hypothetical protein